MKKIATNLSTVILVYLIIMACESRPKVIEGEAIHSEEPPVSSSHPHDIAAINNQISEEHIIVVNEILNTEKYSYLNVTEDGEKNWIAIPRKEVKVGGTYFYKGGLMKKNFESKEYSRVFKTIYLVSDVIPHPSNGGNPESSKALVKEEISRTSARVVPAVGSITLSELFSDPKRFEGKLIQITGKCAKVNPKIMGRNWIHIQDGSGDGLDLTITTIENVNLDATVTFEGTIALNRDFGAGYKYEVIMENASIR